ncbi:hypothetical protein RvVAR0630_07160 [Agrobacterium vitis]|nr:hypothetical protein RvVAR0630_07160 [Agrobacterium vitis]
MTGRGLARMIVGQMIAGKMTGGQTIGARTTGVPITEGRITCAPVICVQAISVVTRCSRHKASVLIGQTAMRRMETVRRHRRRQRRVRLPRHRRHHRVLPAYPTRRIARHGNQARNRATDIGKGRFKRPFFHAVNLKSCCVPYPAQRSSRA